VDFIFFAGDLVILGFSDPAREDSALIDWRFVLDTLSAHDVRVFACRGNNDLGSKASWNSLFKGEYALPQNGPQNEKNITYSFEYNNILFIAFDHYTKVHRINQPWLDEILEKNTKPFVFAAGHEPAFKVLKSNSMTAYPVARDSMWESLITAGTKIFFCAHDHFYDHAIIDDNDGNLENDIHQIVVGTGSYPHNDSEYDGDNGRWIPTRQFHEQANGYVLVEVSDSDMQVSWKQRIDSALFADGGDSYNLSITAIKKDINTIANYSLSQNYPNPFNPITNIEYRIKTHLNASQHINLSIYNLLGQKVATLVNKKQAAGNYKVEWDASCFATGVYYYKLTARDYQHVKKMVLIK